MSRRSNHSGDGPPPLPGESRRGCGKTFLIILLVVGGVTFAGLAAVGTLMELGAINSGEIERGEDLNEKTRAILEDTFLRTDETVIWFYSADLIDAAGDGNVLTDQRVVSYFEDTEGEVSEDKRLYVDWALLEDITAVRVKLSATFIEDSELQVWYEATVEGAVLFEGVDWESAPEALLVGESGD